MRIHSDTITTQNIAAAASYARVGIEVLTEHGSRSRAKAFEVQLSGSSSYRAQGGWWLAATWDEWGNFLHFLYGVDDNMLAGQPSYGYDGQDDFLSKTAEALESHLHYQEITGRKRAGYTAPWLQAVAA